MLNAKLLKCNQLLYARSLTALPVLAIASPLAPMMRLLTGAVMNFSQIKAEHHYEESQDWEEGGAADMHEPAVHWLEGFLESVAACRKEIQSFIQIKY